MRMMAVTRLLALAGFAAALHGLGGAALADKWSYPAEVAKETFEFGKSKFILEVDGKRDQYLPPHTLSIYLNDELVARYRNIGFAKVYASEGNRYFVGLSNRGIPGTAFVIFDAEGNLIREEKHRFLPPGVHTSMSVTLVREWFNDKEPAVEFKMDGDRLTAVFVQGSNGQRYDLLKADLGRNAEAGKLREEDKR